MLHDVGSVDRVLSDREQFAGAASLAEGFVFSSQAGVDQTEHAEGWPEVGLFAHRALDFGTRGSEGFLRCLVVPEGARDTTLHEVELAVERVHVKLIRDGR